MNRAGRYLAAVCAVASLLVTGVRLSPVSAKTINGCVIKAKTECKNAKLKGAKLNKANLKGAELQGEPLGFSCRLHVCDIAGWGVRVEV